MSRDGDRPVHLDVDCATHARIESPITDEEWDAMDARSAAAAEAEAADAAEHEQLRQAVAAHPDPLVQALAKRAGIA